MGLEFSHPFTKGSSYKLYRTSSQGCLFLFQAGRTALTFNTDQELQSQCSKIPSSSYQRWCFFQRDASSRTQSNIMSGSSISMLPNAVKSGNEADDANSREIGISGSSAGLDSVAEEPSP